MKICVKCHLDKDEKEYQPGKHRCKECTKEYMKDYQRNRKEKNIEKGVPVEGISLECKECKENKDCSLFVKNISKPYGREPMCKLCASSLAKTSYHTKKENAPMTEGTKVCTKCNVEFPLTHFSPSPIGKFGRTSQCMECIRVKSKSYRDLTGYQEKATSRIKDKYVARKIEFFNWLQGKQCVDCGVDDFRTLTFDHLRDKSFGIANKIGKVDNSVIFDEIAKCEIVCSNCHLIRSAIRADYYSYLDWYDKDAYKVA